MDRALDYESKGPGFEPQMGYRDYSRFYNVEIMLSKSASKHPFSCVFTSYEFKVWLKYLGKVENYSTEGNIGEILYYEFLYQQYHAL